MRAVGPVVLLVALLAVVPGGVGTAPEPPEDAGGPTQDADQAEGAEPAGAAAVSEAARREAALRESLGFQSDPGYVQRLIDDPERYDAVPDEDTLGYHFTPDERAEFAIRMDLQRSGIEISTYALEHAPEEYAGARLDHETGQLVVGFTSRVEQHREQALARVSDPSRLRVVQAPYSRADYRAMTDALLDAGPSLHRQGVAFASVSTDWEQGALLVGIDDEEFNARGRALDERHERYTQAIRAVLPLRFQMVDIRFVEPEMATGQSRETFNPPLRGGVHFRMDRPNDSNGNCTSGFVTRRPNSWGGVQWGILTAGHCGYSTTRVRWGNSDSSTTVGFVLTNSWYESSWNTQIFTDTAYLHINSALQSRWIYKDLNRQAYAITRSIAPIEAKGYVVCQSGIKNPGAAAGDNCGTIYNDDVNGYLPYFCGGTPQQCKTVAHWVGVRGDEMNCESGDSGSPVHAGPEAWGIHYGSNPITGNCYYSRIRYAIYYHGLTDVETG